MSLPSFHRQGTLNVNLLAHILIVCPSWGLIKVLLFALMFVVYPVAQISIYVQGGIYKAKPDFCAYIFHCL